MQDAWIYTANRESAEDLARHLAGLGFSPRHIGGGDTLVPGGEDGAAIRSPALAVVVAGPGEAVPNELCGALRERDELVDVPLLLALEPEHLEACSEVASAHELLVRPFSASEVRARVARARRSVGAAEAGELLRAGSLELDLVTYQVSIEGIPVDFTYLEYQLLKFLMTHPSRVFSREALLKRVWGYDYYGGARTVDVHIRRLRAKLGQEHAARIKTVRSVGYLFETGPVAVARNTPVTHRQSFETRASQPGHSPALASVSDMSYDGGDSMEIGEKGLTRREVVQRGSAFALAAALPLNLTTRARAATGAGSPVRIGFIALTDCASVVMAYENGFYQKRGVNVQLIKQASWPATRDALLNGDIDAAHCLFALPFSVATGIGGPAGTNKLKVAMMLNQNGQGITLKKDWAAAGYDNLKKAKTVMKGGEGQTYAMTFPGGTHDTWLRYWLKAMGIDMSVPKIIPIPPPQMVANMQVGAMDGFCVGEPWNGVAAQKGIGFTELATQDLWEFHPEKALVVNADFAGGRTGDLKKVMGGILEASKWLDYPVNRAKTADVIGRPAYVNASSDVIQGRLNGTYDLGSGLGTKKFLGDQMRFCRNGKVNFPRHSHALWFMAQYVRFGYLKSEPNYKTIANDLILSDLYKQVAHAEGFPVPNDDMTPFQVELDKVTFDPRKPHKEAMRR